LVAVPLDNDTGLVDVSLSLTWNDMVVYQNFTIIVCQEVISTEATQWMSLVVALALGFGFAIVGMTNKLQTMVLLSGLAWLYAALAVYATIDIGWAVISLGIGISLLVTGGIGFAGNEKKR